MLASPPLDGSAHHSPASPVLQVERKEKRHDVTTPRGDPMYIPELTQDTKSSCAPRHARHWLFAS
jgi:hypothetical protein